ncbi:hypothetical protein [Sphingomicrobium astaxanthinifaciens]|uniref:hypothetical protein n=1 Tax=Sphingomicrobium astaxanthinifaciens TaxID=1227949 RepID=UPI001FCA72C2|nr:hypothetical protein [Sphingomicrobium astaxanthinifaciens]MCJ7421606.1 hypothetical protein [Sphingomicrobium astaxanthinifaciens]
MKTKALPIFATLALAACGRAEADPVSLENDLPVEAMVVTEDERSARVEAEVAEVAAQRAIDEMG